MLALRRLVCELVTLVRQKSWRNAFQAANAVVTQEFMLGTVQLLQVHIFTPRMVWSKHMSGYTGKMKEPSERLGNPAKNYWQQSHVKLTKIPMHWEDETNPLDVTPIRSRIHTNYKHIYICKRLKVYVPCWIQ